MKHNVRIARSGVQYYMRSELPTLGLTSVPREFDSLRVFGVYRPSHVLKDAVPLFKHVPLVIGHSHIVSGPNDSHIIGSTGDEPKLKMLDGELVLTSTIEFDDETNKPDYDELSPGYMAKNHWQSGTACDGTPFQIVCDKIQEVNHLAIVPKARGGENMKILDGGNSLMFKQIHSGLLRFLHKKSKGVADSEDDVFLQILEDAKANFKSWNEQDIESHTDSLLTLTKDLPDSEEKHKLQRYIADIPVLKGEDDATVAAALDAICSLYTSLDTDAISDVMEKPMANEDPKKQETAAPATEPAKPQDAAPADKPVATEPAKPTEPSKPTEQKDDATAPAVPAEDPMTKLTSLLSAMNDKLDALSKHLSGTGAAPCGDAGAVPPANSTPCGDAEPKKEEPKKEEPVQGDAAPQIPLYTQTLGTMQSGDSLDAMFAKMKERR